MAKYHSHIPVLLDESVELLITDKNGIYIDATLGNGGHTKLILENTGSHAEVFGIDQDMDALDEARLHIDSDPRFKPILGNFGYLSTLIPPNIHGQIDGVLFDLGVSTHQIKEPGRGFSFQHDGPLDMRMGDLSGVSAHEVVNDYSYNKLRDIIFHYGEEKLSRQIARAITETRPISSTSELRTIIEQVVFGKYAIKSVARVFQAIRIEVNRELDMLKSALDESLEILKPGGRIVTISYHSLEDRIVKTFFRSGNHDDIIEKDFYGNEVKNIEPLTRQIIVPTEQEVKQNPSARSAKLRAAHKILQED